MVQPATESVAIDVLGTDDEGGVKVYTVGIQKALAAKPGSKVDVTDGHSKPDELTDIWTSTPLIPTPLPIDGLILWYGRSQVLRPYVMAMAQGVAGQGWKLEPMINLDGEHAAEEVETAMYLNRLAKYEQETEGWKESSGKKKPAEPERPTPEEVEATMDEWKRDARLEKARLEIELQAMCYEGPFEELNRQQEIGQNVVGWGAWEVIRSPNGRKINRLKSVEPYTLRLTTVCDPEKVTESVPVSKVHYLPVEVERRFRKIVQIGTRHVYFKEFGDPRVMSRDSGEYYKTRAELQKSEGMGQNNAEEATEILWFADYHPGTPYGMPPWHGTTPYVRGARLAADNVVDDLLNASIPRGMLLTSDVRLGKDLQGQIQSFFSSRHGQMRNRLLVVEAMTAKSAVDTSGNIHARMEYIPMKKEQNQDATFLEYQKMAGVETGAQFGIPPILVGKSADYNRATSDAARRAVEENVFAPRRRRFDDRINRTLFRDMGVRFWRFESCAPSQTDLDKVSKLLIGAMKEGAITPVEARPLLAQLLGTTLTEEAGPWQRQTQGMTLAGMLPPEDDTAEEATGDDEADADSLEKALAALREYDDLAAGADALAKALGARMRSQGEQMVADSMGHGED